MSVPKVKYNPGIHGDEELISSFVVRKVELELALETLRENAAATHSSNQHLLFVGPRGIGKTMLVRRVAAEVRKVPDLSAAWYPIVFGEESYEVCSPGEFWLEALFHLAEQTGDERWLQAHKELKEEADEARLRDRALAHLLDFADREGKRLLLVVENLNRLLGDQIEPSRHWDLRHTLQNERRIMLLGTATTRFEEIQNIDKAWFEMFAIRDLKPLDLDECTKLWRSATDWEPEPGQVRAVQILTGGNPRLLVILAGFAAKRSLRELMEQLTQLVDDHTEYFKSHLDNLPAVERKVFAALLDIWDPVGAREVARAVRMGVNNVSVQLNRLVGRGAVEVVRQDGRRKLYQAAERLYNIYYLMRRRGRPSARVRAAVDFMVHFYEEEELVEGAAKLAQEACGLASEQRSDHYVAFRELLNRIPSLQLRHRILEAAPQAFFEGPGLPEQLVGLGELKARRRQLAETVILDCCHSDAPRLWLVGRLAAREARDFSGPWFDAQYLTTVLGLRGQWRQALDAVGVLLEAAVAEWEAQLATTALLEGAAAAGYAREVLEMLVASPAAAALEPLAVGLRIYLGEDPLVAQEVLEVGKDVAERIRQLQAAFQKGPTPSAVPPAPHYTR